MDKMISIAMIDGMGRSLLANKTLPASTIIEVSELLILSPEDTVKVNQTDLKHYTFSYRADQDCLVLSLGEIFNHSSTPNVAYYLIDDDGRPKMVFITLTQVEAGEQLFIDYAADANIDVNSYVQAKSLI